VLFFFDILKGLTVKTVTVELGKRSYDINIASGLLDRTGERLLSLPVSKNVAVITNSTVAPLYLDRVRNSLLRAGYRVNEIVLPDGEQHKTLETVSGIYDQLARMDFDRNCPVIALGGGVIGDMAGFAAATFLRGVPYIQIPTTLLSQVDSSVGGKTGVNLSEGKNLVGAFYQPGIVIIDPDVLVTLDPSELKAGLAEVIKYGVILDADFFAFLEKNMANLLALDHDALVHVIKTCCALKAEVTSQDEKEKGLRSILNFGHTIGHAVETLANYQDYIHGEAVAIGMAAVAKLSVYWGLTDAAAVERLIGLLNKTALPIDLPSFSINYYLDVMLKDKKRAADGVKMVLMKRIGEVCLALKTPQDLSNAMKTVFGFR